MIRALIVDDEEIARSELKRFLKNETDFEVAGEAVDGEEALEAVERLAPDVLFMDIHIPHTNGLEVAAILSRLQAPPIVVFVTAYDQHAISAFEISAVDYVLKPYDRDRFRRACQKVRDWLGKREEARGRLSGLVDYLGRQKTCSLVGRNRHGKDRIFIRYEDVAYFKVELTQILVTLKTGEELTVSGTLRSLTDQLDPGKFHQTHRSFIVSLDAVERISPLFAGNFEIILKTSPKIKIPLSRRYAQKLRKILPW